MSQIYIGAVSKSPNFALKIPLNITDLHFKITRITDL